MASYVNAITKPRAAHSISGPSISGPPLPVSSPSARHYHSPTADDDQYTPERHLATPRQRGHSPQRHAAAGTAAPTATDTARSIWGASISGPPGSVPSSSPGYHSPNSVPNSISGPSISGRPGALSSSPGYYAANSVPNSISGPSTAGRPGSLPSPPGYYAANSVPYGAAAAAASAAAAAALAQTLSFGGVTNAISYNTGRASFGGIASNNGGVTNGIAYNTGGSSFGGENTGGGGQHTDGGVNTGGGIARTPSTGPLKGTLRYSM